VFPRPAPSLFNFPGISSRAYYDTENDKIIFNKYADVLKKNYEIILGEYKTVLLRSNSDGDSDYKLKSDEHKLNNGEWVWNSYILKGKEQPKFSENYPETAKILKSFLSEKPKLMSETPFSYAFFSTLKKDSKIAPHYGPCNLRVRCHFPLIIPKGDCGMEVGGKQIKWQEGVPLFFDDCYEHHGNIKWQHLYFIDLIVNFVLFSVSFTSLF
jgi:Aspartyl/Asparaginyl beta-hydroxylase